MPYIRKKTIEGLKSGDFFSITRTFTEKDMIDFADITKDYNPVHFDKQFAKIKRFNDRICHGLLVGSILTEIGGQIGWLATEMNLCFKKPVYFNDKITCHFTIIKIDSNKKAKAKAIFKNQDQEIVIEASLAGIIPGSAEKEIMKNI